MTVLSIGFLNLITQLMSYIITILFSWVGGVEKNALKALKLANPLPPSITTKVLRNPKNKQLLKDLNPSDFTERLKLQQENHQP